MIQTKFNTREELLSENLTIVVDEEHPHSFSMIAVGRYKYGVAWNGNLPIESKEIDKYDLIVYSVGEKVIAFNRTSGIMQLCIGINFPFMFFEEVTLGFVVVSELSIIVINAYNCSISRFIVSSDIIQNVRIEGDKFHVECLDSNFVA